MENKAKKDSVDPILQEFYDGFVWDETDLGCDVNPDVVWDKSQQSNILMLLKLCGHDPEDLTRLGDTNDPPVPVLPRVTPAPMAAPVPFPKESCLTLKQMRTFLVWEQRYKFSDNAQNVTQGSRQGFRDYQTMKNNVLLEQEEYQQYLSRAAMQAIRKYNYVDPEAGEWVKNRMQAGALDLKRYPRYYVSHKKFGINVIPFVTDTLPTQIDMRHEFFGHAKNLKTRKFPIPLSPKFLAKSGQESEKPVITEDKNAEILAVAWDADVVISMSSLHTLADNFGKLEKAWEIPVAVRKHGSKKIVFIDRPLPPKFIMPREKNLLYFRKLYKAAMNVDAAPQLKKAPVLTTVDDNAENLHGSVNKSMEKSEVVREKSGSSGTLPTEHIQGGPEDKSAPVSDLHEGSSDVAEHAVGQPQKNSPDRPVEKSLPDENITSLVQPVEDRQHTEQTSSSASDSYVNASNLQSDALSSEPQTSGKPDTSMAEVSEIKIESDFREEAAVDAHTHINVHNNKSSSDEFTSSDTCEKAPHSNFTEKNTNNNNRKTEQSHVKTNLVKAASSARVRGSSASSDEDAGLIMDVTDESDVPQLDGASDDKPKNKKPRATTRKRAPKKTQRNTSKLEPPPEESLYLSSLEDGSNDDNVNGIDKSAKKQTAGLDAWKSSFSSLPRSDFVKVGASNLFGSAATSQSYTRRNSSEASEKEDESTTQKAGSSRRKSSSNSAFELSFGASADLVIDETALKQEDEPKKKRARKKPVAQQKVPQIVLEKIDSPVRQSRKETEQAVPTSSKPRQQTGKRTGAKVGKEGGSVRKTMSGKRSVTATSAGSVSEDSSTSKGPATDQAVLLDTATHPPDTAPTNKALTPNVGAEKKLLSPNRIFSFTVKVPTPKVSSAHKQVEVAAPMSDVLGRIMMDVNSTPRRQKSSDTATLPPAESSKKRAKARKIRETAVVASLLQPPPDSENVGYALWQFRDKRVLVRYSLHGTMLSNEKQDPWLCNVSFQTKLEYQTEFAYEQVTPSEICHNWVTMYFKPPGTRIVRGRIDPFKRKLLDVEWPTSREVMGQAAIIGFSPLKTSKCISTVFDKLAELKPDRYLCSHKSRETEVSILKKVENPMKHVVYDIAEVYRYPGRDATYNTWVPWVPADPEKQLPFHKHKRLIPLMFNPRGESAAQPHKRSSSVKGKKRGPKKKQKRLCDTDNSDDSGASD